MVTVRVTGFALGGLARLSECATAADANPLGCGPQLAAQPMLITENNGAGSTTFVVSTRASGRPYSPEATTLCTDSCVLVATLGTPGGYVFARLAFTG